MKNKNISIPTSINLKHQISFIFALLFLATNIIAQDISATPNQNVTNLCYKKVVTEKIRVTGGTDYDNLTTTEKLMFLKKTETTTHKNTYTSGEVVFEINTVTSENTYPKWYPPATKIQVDNEGTKSFYVTNKYVNRALLGTRSKTENGEYFTNNRTGQQYLHMKHSHTGEIAHQRITDIVKQKGLLYKFVYPKLTKKMTADLVNRGLKTTQTNKTTVLKNNDVVMVWDDTRRAMIIQTIESGSVTKTTTYYYKYNETFNDYLLVNESVVTPATFENGDCYDNIRQTKYTDYSSSCK